MKSFTRDRSNTLDFVDSRRPAVGFHDSKRGGEAFPPVKIQESWVTINVVNRSGFTLGQWCPVHLDDVADVSKILEQLQKDRLWNISLGTPITSTSWRRDNPVHIVLAQGLGPDQQGIGIVKGVVPAKLKFANELSAWVYQTPNVITHQADLVADGDGVVPWIPGFNQNNTSFLRWVSDITSPMPGVWGLVDLNHSFDFTLASPALSVSPSYITIPNSTGSPNWKIVSPFKPANVSGNPSDPLYNVLWHWVDGSSIGHAGQTFVKFKKACTGVLSWRAQFLPVTAGRVTVNASNPTLYSYGPSTLAINFGKIAGIPGNGVKILGHYFYGALTHSVENGGILHAQREITFQGLEEFLVAKDDVICFHVATGRVPLATETGILDAKISVSGAISISGYALYDAPPQQPGGPPVAPP